MPRSNRTYLAACAALGCLLLAVLGVVSSVAFLSGAREALEVPHAPDSGSGGSGAGLQITWSASAPGGTSGLIVNTGRTTLHGLQVFIEHDKLVQARGFAAGVEPERVYAIFTPPGGMTEQYRATLAPGASASLLVADGPLPFPAAVHAIDESGAAVPVRQALPR